MLFENMIVDDVYQVIEEIGSGGMGVVYLAYHLRLEKYVVLKQIKNPSVSTAMLRNEVDILKSLHHPYLPQVYDFIEFEGDIYTVIDYIDGYDLNCYIDNGWQFTESQLIKWLRQLCEVLSYLHTHYPPVLHTDIKPGNIIITTGGDICLIDFGISVYNTDVIKGLSENYSSPEQYGNFYYLQYGEGTYLQLDERTDIYSLGATFYHIMTGVRPDVRNTGQLPLSAYSLPYSDALIAIVDCAMQRDINRRFCNAKTMLRAIDDIRKQDVRYKKYLLIQAASSVIAALLVISGVLMISSGYNQQVRTDFEREYHEFLTNVSVGDSEKTAQSGMHILNQTGYSSMLDDSQKADLLSKIADCFYSDEDYYNAAYYSELALKYEKSELNYRDCIFALMMGGRTDEAQTYVSELGTNYPGSAVLTVTEAQLCYVRGDYEGAVNKVDNCLSQLEGDSENYYAAQLIAGDSYCALRSYGYAVDAYEGARSVKETEVVLRKLGNAHIQAAVKNGSAADKRAALSCFDRISEAYSPNTDDVLNLTQMVLSLGETARYEECKRLLSEYAERRDDCRLYMLLAELADATEDAAAEKYCEKAHALYETLGDDEASGVSSESLESVRRLYKKYCGAGW